MEDVARAFDTILHKGRVGHVYNIGGVNEYANIDVAKKLLQLMGKVGPEESLEDPETLAKYVTYVQDRPFNDVHYRMDSSKVAALGWKEEVSWDEGLARTIDWYKTNSDNWGDLAGALVPHPRRGAGAHHHH